MQTFDRITARLDRLERECRWWRRSAAATALLLMAVLLCGAHQGEVPKRIEAEAFVLKDSSGEIKAVLGAWERSHEVFLRFLGEGGQRVDLGTQFGSPVMIFRGKDRRVGLALGVTPPGVGSIQVRPSEDIPSPKPIVPADIGP